MSTEKITAAPLARTLSAVAVEIADVWPAVRRAGTYDPHLGLRIGEHPAHPYLVAMAAHTSSDLAEPYGADDMADVVARFLDNSSGWRGEAARRIKAELRAALAHNAVATHAPVDYPAPRRDRYAQCDDTCTTDCGACKGAGPPASDVDARRRETMRRYRASRGIAGNDRLSGHPLDRRP